MVFSIFAIAMIACTQRKLSSWRSIAITFTSAAQLSFRKIAAASEVQLRGRTFEFDSSPTDYCSMCFFL
jgi:hypothetical protein